MSGYDANVLQAPKAAQPARDLTPIESALSRLEACAARLRSVTSQVIETHANVQSQAESPSLVPETRDSVGSSIVIQALDRVSDDIDGQIERLYSFIARSEVAGAFA